MKKNNGIPKGAIQIHLYPYQNILKPRGSMRKESIGTFIYDRLKSTYEDWRNPKYGDNPDKETLLQQLKHNLSSEVEVAWNKFINGK
jgi:hypothetical protein